MRECEGRAWGGRECYKLKKEEKIIKVYKECVEMYLGHTLIKSWLGGTRLIVLYPNMGHNVSFTS